MDIASILNPMLHPIPRLPKRSCNKAYTLEQIHFIQYCKEDLKLSWLETEARFKERFPDPGRHVSVVGLQCRYYRAQKYPMLDIEGNPVLIDSGIIAMRNLTVRERGQKGGLIIPILDHDGRAMHNDNNHVIVRELTDEELHSTSGRNLSMAYQRYFKLVDRVPEYVARYEWVRNDHKAVAKRNGTSCTFLPHMLDIDLCIAKYNKDNGIELPGAVLPGGIEVETILWGKENARHNSANGLAFDNICGYLQVLSMARADEE
jgi:hypothetical protein